MHESWKEEISWIQQCFSMFAERGWSGQIYLLMYQVISQEKTIVAIGDNSEFSLRISNILGNEVVFVSYGVSRSPEKWQFRKKLIRQ